MSGRPRVLVLGSGFIGSHLGGALAAAGYPVRFFSTARRGWEGVAALAAGAERVTGDISDRDAVRAAAAGCEIAVDAVGTALPADAALDPAADAERNLLPSLRAFAQARAAGLRRLVFISSGGTVYGRARALPIAEDHPTDPISAYGVVKLALEKYLAVLSDAHGFASTVLRLGNVYGERQSPDRAQGAVAVFLGRAQASRAIDIWGDGEVVRDFVHAADVGRALLAVLAAEPRERVFNVGTGVGTSLAALAQAIGRVTGRELPITYHPARAIDVPANVLDPSRLARATGWRAEVTLEEGLRRTAAWVASQPPPAPP